MDEITRQARQGSMAALIQLLNEQLADAGVRTRAMFSEGILQLLCEAATVEQLEQTQLVCRVQEILEQISPNNFRRVNINARIAREQQLLWLEEINRDPESQLLWSEEISIKSPSFVQQLKQQIQERKPPSRTKQQLPRARSASSSPTQSYRRGLAGGILLSVLAIGGVWVLWNWRSLIPSFVQGLTAETSAPTTSPSSAAPAPPAAPPDPFVEAVRLAELASIQGKTAQSAAEWLDLAAKWKRASDLMKSVPDGDLRYATAQNRVVQYHQNSKMAQKRADQAS